MWQHNGNEGARSSPYWSLRCKSCAGSSMTLDPAPKLLDGARVGLLLDLDNGGTLTMYLDNTPCGTIAEGLVGPLLPCVASYHEGQEVAIKGGFVPAAVKVLTAETAF